MHALFNAKRGTATIDQRRPVRVSRVDADARSDVDVVRLINGRLLQWPWTGFALLAPVPDRQVALTAPTTVRSAPR